MVMQQGYSMAEVVKSFSKYAHDPFLAAMLYTLTQISISLQKIDGAPSSWQWILQVSNLIKVLPYDHPLLLRKGIVVVKYENYDNDWTIPSIVIFRTLCPAFRALLIWDVPVTKKIKVVNCHHSLDADYLLC
jgi:hypothetical protein